MAALTRTLERVRVVGRRAERAVRRREVEQDLDDGAGRRRTTDDTTRHSCRLKPDGRETDGLLPDQHRPQGETDPDGDDVLEVPEQPDVEQGDDGIQRRARRGPGLATGGRSVTLAAATAPRAPALKPTSRTSAVRSAQLPARAATAPAGPARRRAPRRGGRRRRRSRPGGCRGAARTTPGAAAPRRRRGGTAPARARRTPRSPVSTSVPPAGRAGRRRPCGAARGPSAAYHSDCVTTPRTTMVDTTAHGEGHLPNQTGQPGHRRLARRLPRWPLPSSLPPLRVGGRPHP